MQELRVFLLGQHKPRHHDGSKQRQPGEPRQVQDFFELARPQQPDKQHQPRQRKTDHALAQHGQGAGHKAQPCQARVRPVACHERKPKAPDRHANPRGHHHVVVDVLAADQHREAGAQHDHSAPCNLLSGHRAGRQVQCYQHHARVQRRHQPQGPCADTQRSQRQGLQPVQQGRLVEERNAVEPGRQPVAALQHPAADLAIAPLIGHGQGPHCGQQQQQSPQQGQRQPRLLSLAWVTQFIWVTGVALVALQWLMAVGMFHGPQFTNWPL